MRSDSAAAAQGLPLPLIEPMHIEQNSAMHMNPLTPAERCASIAESTCVRGSAGHLRKCLTA